MNRVQWGSLLLTPVRSKAPIEVYRDASTGEWEWACWRHQHRNVPHGVHATHAEALAAALNHCAEAGKR